MRKDPRRTEIGEEKYKMRWPSNIEKSKLRMETTLEEVQEEEEESYLTREEKPAFARIDNMQTK